VQRSRALWIAVTALIALALMAGPISTAGAQVASSQITRPSANSFPLDDETLSNGGAKITVEGTATGTAKVDIGCYGGEEAEEVEILAEEVSVKSHAFSTSIARSELPAYLCTLRAVPSEEAEELEEPELAESFKGPLMAASSFAAPSSSSYEALADGIAGEFGFDGAEECGMESLLYGPTSMLMSEELFSCAGFLEDRPEYPSDGLQVDGAYGYGPLSAARVEEVVEPDAALGAPTMTVTKSFDEATGAMVIHEEDPIVKCEPESLPTPTKATCTSFASTGITLERTWETSDSGHVASLTDHWSSTDGQAHSLSVEYVEEMSAATEGGVYELPGSSAFAATQAGESVTLPSGAASILYKSSSSTGEDEANGVHPQGAIVYDSSPSEALQVLSGSAEAGANEFALPYRRTIAAGSAATLRTTFIQAFDLPEVRQLAAAALESYYPSDHPSVTIASPEDGTTITSESPHITVSGSANDAIALSSVTVDEQPVLMSPSGTWTATVTLKPGANTLTAQASNEAGETASSSVTVSYVAPAPASGGGGLTTGTETSSSTTGATTSGSGTATGTAAGVHASLVGLLSSIKGKVVFTLACTGPAGSSCVVQTTLGAIEKRRNGKLVAVAAAGMSSTHVTVGTAKSTIAAGQELKVAIALNAAGRRLLAKFASLPVRLTTSLLEGSSEERVMTRTLTVKQAPAKPSTR
jgi:Glucodextranase, domain B